MRTMAASPTMTLHSLPGASPFKEPVLKAIQSLNRCDGETFTNANALKSVMTPGNKAQAREIVARAQAQAEMGPMDVFARGPAGEGSVNAEEYMKVGQTAPMS